MATGNELLARGLNEELVGRVPRDVGIGLDVPVQTSPDRPSLRAEPVQTAQIQAQEPSLGLRRRDPSDLSGLNTLQKIGLVFSNTGAGLSGAPGPSPVQRLIAQRAALQKQQRVRALSCSLNFSRAANPVD